MNKQQKLIKLQKRLKRKPNDIWTVHMDICIYGHMDMQKTYRPLLRRYPLRTGNVNADRTKTHQWLISCGLKREKEGLI